MPEAKNTFLKAKMNKDLDERLLPNGEYRHAQNIIVNKSEDDSVGTMQAIKGNLLIESSNNAGSANIVGYFMDNTNNRIFTFLDDNTIRVLQVPSNGAYSPEDTNISYTTLVSGDFLNFSTTNYNENLQRNEPANFNVNLLEDLLFWTDNKNQPRKINVKKALADPNYYSKEEHISVAKYNPYQPISLFKQEIELITSASSSGTSFNVAENTNIEVGMTVLAINPNTLSPVTTMEASDYVTVTNINTVNSTTTVTVSDNVTWSQGDKVFFVISTMSDKSNDETWPGDPDYLESKFVRIGYRFKFDDNEYSIFSPFTQIAYIPKQKGYFLNGQEEETVSSTILNWFENSVNNVDLIIPLPDKAYNIINSYKIKSIEILYKESDQIPVKVIDTIDVSNFLEEDHSENYYEYSYQSRKPIRTLPEAQTVRVYDKVPVKAKTQEIISNRIVYGNFLTKHTPPDSLSYGVSVQKKNDRGGNTNFIEYPNHTLKQNRNYQIGFVLADKFGRQSDVILSKVKQTASNPGGGEIRYGGSTVYTGYAQDDPEGSGIIDETYFPEGVIGWEGNSLVLNVTDPIEGNSKTPLYAEPVGNGFDIEYSTITTITPTQYTFTLSTAANALVSVPSEGDYLRGQYIDYVEVTSSVETNGVYDITTDGQINEMYLINPNAEETNLPDTKYAYRINSLGWYSYKIVVKQTEQEYYNVYLPSAIGADDGTDTFVVGSTDTSETVSYIVLINDNINKVPRDLSEVGPDQKQYRSSVRLFGRVKPTSSGDPDGVTEVTFSNAQFYPINKSDVSTAIGNTNDLLEFESGSENNKSAVFQYSSDPIIARISTSAQFGIDYNFLAATNILSGENRFQLAVYETEPVVSALDIYWETSEAGLISDLNWDVLTGYDGPVALGEFSPTLNENFEIGDAVGGDFAPLNNLGTEMLTTICSSFQVIDTNGIGDDVTDKFVLTQLANGKYQITTNNTFVYEYNSSNIDQFKFNLTFNPTTNEEWENVTLSFTVSLENTPPFYDAQPTADPYYYYTLESSAGDEIHNFQNSNNPVNGAFANKQNGLRWDLENFEDSNLFNLSPSGSLTLTQAGADAGINNYTIRVTLRDATSENLNGVGSEFFTRNINIIKGYSRTNILSNAVEYNGIFDIDTSSTEFNDSHTFIYYLSNSTLAASNLPTGANSPLEEEPYQIGDALTRGTFLFGIENARAENYDDPGFTDADFEIQYNLTVYHRSTSNDEWQKINDLNNRSTSQTELGKYTDAVRPQNKANNSLTRYEQNFWFAQSAEGTGIYANGNNSGEYAFVIDLNYLVDDSSDRSATYDHSIYIRDLHYTSAEDTQEVYRYTVYQNTNSTGWDSQGDVRISGTEDTVYSDQPLGEYNRKYFEDADLTTIWTPPTANKWYLFRVEYQEIEGVDRSIEDRTWEYLTTVNTRRYDCSAKVNANGDIDEATTPHAFTLKTAGNDLVAPLRRGNDTNDGKTYFSW